jgi:uncharacterized protein YndB with AHSA1/START domain
MTQANINEHACTIFIKASRETVWEGLTSAEFTRRYFHSTDIESDWKPGSSVTFYNQDKSVAVKGEVLEVDYPSKLSFTWHVHYNPEALTETPSRVTYLLEAIEDSTKLTLVHDNFPVGSVVLPLVSQGWIAILSNLKTLLETGDVMAVS